MENLKASEVALTDEEFATLENRLSKVKIYGKRQDVNHPTEFF